MPNKLMNRFGRLLCTCNKTRFQETDQDIFHKCSSSELKSWFNDNVFEKTDHGLVSVETFLGKMLNDLTEEHVSRMRFLVIIKQAMEGDLEILKQKVVIEKADHRQKYPFEDEIEIPLARRFLPYMIGSAGCRIKPVCKKYNCEIRFDSKRQQWGYPFTRNLSTQIPNENDKTKTIIKTKTAAEMKEVKNTLLEMAAEVHLKRRAHAKKVEKYEQYGAELRKRREERRQNLYDARLLGGGQSSRGGRGSYGFWKAADEVKENNRDKFDVKSKHHGDDKRNKHVNILATGSRCMNCKAAYEKGATEKDACRHHPGYLLKREAGSKEQAWSCCGVLSRKEDEMSSHQEDGCEIGHHNWRPTKENRNAKGKKDSSSKPLKIKNM